jgi:hypothetical protein
MTVRLLTLSQKESLESKEYKPNCYFNPIEDNHGNWVISNDEVIQCVNPTVTWVNELPVIDYIPQPEPNLWGL